MIRKKWMALPATCAGIVMVLSLSGFAQEKPAEEKEKSPYVFTVIREVPRTPVKNQAATGTCWCFSALSMLESELLRMGKPEMDLSEMFIVRHAYSPKAENYVRLHGTANFDQGGAAHDVIDMMKVYGIVPDDVYPGLNYGEKKHDHGEIVSMMKGMLDAVIHNRRGRLTPKWQEAIEAVLDIYFGALPAQFSYKGKMITPVDFMKNVLGLHPEDYIEITSVAYAPFYQKCYLALPDNWTFSDQYYNVPVEDLEKIMDEAIEKGYSLVWGGDVSNRDFSTSKTGYGIVPLKDWEDQTEEERKAKITEPVPEKTVTQELRQAWFDNYTSTDDHGMHIVGIAHDEKGNKYYLTKNSYGIDRKFDGYVYLSKPYVMLYLTAMMVNKNALPKDVKKKLGL